MTRKRNQRERFKSRIQSIISFNSLKHLQFYLLFIFPIFLRATYFHPKNLFVHFKQGNKESVCRLLFIRNIFTMKKSFSFFYNTMYFKPLKVYVLPKNSKSNFTVRIIPIPYRTILPYKYRLSKQSINFVNFEIE